MEMNSIDYVCSWGALILGHAHPKVVQAIGRAGAPRHEYGMPTPNSKSTLRRVSAMLFLRAKKFVL